MRTLRATVPAAAALALLLCGARAASADDDFFRSSPGPLTKSHAEIDGQDNCNECHDGGKATNDDKCLGCHDHNDLRDRIRAGKGFHASSKVKGKKCETCHLEHEGRNFDLMGWKGIGGEKAFDHKLAGWPLVGKHAAIDCSECHKNKNKQGLRTYLGEDKFCGGCHKEDSPHEFDRKEMLTCERCHGESTWKPPLRRMEFDHDDPKDAAMPLEGAHADVSCAKCHPKSRFNLPNKVPDDCANCHKSPHKGHLFDLKKCSWCHSPAYRELQKYRFDHDKKTRFALAGTHNKIPCYDCHTAAMGTRKPDRSCEAGKCHGDENPHADRFDAFGGTPPACGTCHPTSSWKPEVFDHNKRTDFKLVAAHARAACRDCHRGKTPLDFEVKELPSAVGCMGCHRHENAHEGQFKEKSPKAQVRKCMECHKTPGEVKIDERTAISLYHGPKSRFPLEKGHKGVDCEKCHPNAVYENTPFECGAKCHEDSLHRGSLGDECSRCHKGGEWPAVRFDHTDDTDWPLKGWHAKVPNCEDCHPKRVYADTPRDCAAKGCHAADDVHNGALGNKCEQCHLETGANIFDHNTQSEFMLRESHLEVRCAECHPSIEFKPRPRACVGCHPEPDVHKGRFGTACETCHNESDFADILPLHDVGAFSLKGQHDNVECRTCHKDSRPLTGQGNMCVTCHKQDDIHFGSLSPQCGQCHTQWSFAPARFDHSTVGCNLTGLHRTLGCFDCHQAGNFGALAPQCFSCHADTARRVPSHAAAPAAYVNCANVGCHNPNFWTPQALANAYGRNSICR